MDIVIEHKQYHTEKCTSPSIIVLSEGEIYFTQKETTYALTCTI